MIVLQLSRRQIWKTFKPDEEVEVSENDQLVAYVTLSL